MNKNTHQDTNTDTHTYTPSLKTHMHTETNTNQLTHKYSSHEYSPQNDKNCHWLTTWQFFQIKRLKKQEKLFWDKRAVILHFPFHRLILSRLRISKIKTMLAKKKWKLQLLAMVSNGRKFSSLSPKRIYLGGFFDQMKEKWLCNFFFITLCCQNSDALVAKKQRIWKVSTWWKELIELCCNGSNWICSRL